MASDGWLASFRTKVTASASDLLNSLGIARKEDLNHQGIPSGTFYRTVGGTDVDLLDLHSPIACLTTSMDTVMPADTSGMIPDSTGPDLAENTTDSPPDPDSIPSKSDSSTPRACSPYPFEQLGLPLPFTDVDLADWDYETQGGGDTLEIQHFGTIKNLIPIGKSEIGKGHGFTVQSLVNPTWCDKCGDFIWGFFWQAVVCKKCQYTCHLRCQQLVTLDCRSVCDSLKSNRPQSTFLTEPAKDELSDDLISEPVTETTGLSDDDDPFDEEVEAIVDGVLAHVTNEFPRGDELQELIEEYNKYSAGLNMTMEDDGINFRGFLRVHMNFSRPINVVSGEVPPTLYDVINPEETLGRKTITSFFLPRNTVKVLHLTSETSSQEMIVALLKKFKVADNPKKFALYERDLGPGDTLRAKLLRIPDGEYPLRLALRWGSYKRLVLQENESGDIAWDAFEIPELNNFLRILEREETLYIHQIRLKYEQYRRCVDLEMRSRGIASPSEYCGLQPKSPYTPHFPYSIANNGGLVLPTAPPLSAQTSDRSGIDLAGSDVDDLTVDKTIKRFGGLGSNGPVVLNGNAPSSSGSNLGDNIIYSNTGKSINGNGDYSQYSMNGQTTMVKQPHHQNGNSSTADELYQRPYSTILDGTADGSMVINHKINQQFSWPPNALAAQAPSQSTNGSIFDAEYYSDGTIKSSDGGSQVLTGGKALDNPEPEEEQTDV